MSSKLPSISEWRGQGATFEWCGQQVFERIGGSGEALLLIHGFPTASWDWSALWPGLCEHFRVIAVDMLGFGFSAKPPRFDYSILNQANLCEAVLGRHGVERYRILAHDYGVSVAQELLARQRDRGSRSIDSVCFLNGGLFPETHRPLVTQQLLASPLGGLIARSSSFRTFAATMKRIGGSRPIRAEELEAMWALVTESEGLRVLPELIAYMEARRRHRERWVGALVHGSVPLRLVNGLDDPISGSHMAARYRELIPNPDVVALAGVGHYPQLEAPDAVLEAALTFFEGSRDSLVYKICSRAAWHEAEREGAYRGSADDRRDGFIHLSTASQVPGTAAKYFRGEPDLVLVAVDGSTLGAKLRFEPARGGESFPHLYADLPLTAVRWVLDLPWDGNAHVIPPSVRERT